MDIGRCRHFSQLVQEAVEITVIVEFHHPAAKVRFVQHFAIAGIGELDFCAGKSLPARVHQHFPHIIALRRKEKHFHLAAGSSFLSVETGRNHLGIVEYEYIARTDFIQNIPEMMMLPGTGVLIQHHKPAGIAGFRRFLGNELFGKVIVEFFKFH